MASAGHFNSAGIIKAVDAFNTRLVNAVVFRTKSHPKILIVVIKLGPYGSK